MNSNNQQIIIKLLSGLSKLEFTKLHDILSRADRELKYCNRDGRAGCFDRLEARLKEFLDMIELTSTCWDLPTEEEQIAADRKIQSYFNP